MTEPTRKLIAETKEWRASLTGELIEFERPGQRWQVPVQDLPDLRWLIEKVIAYTSLSTWEKQHGAEFSPE